MKILVTEPQEISLNAVKLLKSQGHEVVSAKMVNFDTTIQGLFIRTYTKVTTDLLNLLPSLSFIIRAGTGLDNIDLKSCQERHIKIFNSPGVNANSVAEHALSTMLMVLKNTNKHIDNVRQGLWRTRTLLGSELKGKTVGLIGCGAVGQRLARLLQPFEVNLLGYDKYVNPKVFADLSILPTELPKLLRDSDVITIQVPLTSETNKLIGEREFALLKRSSYLINVSRGEVVEEDPLLRALSSNAISGAAIDVVIGEPNPNPRLLSLQNLIITPHIAGFTKEADEAIAIEAVRNFIASMEKKI